MMVTHALRLWMLLLCSCTVLMLACDKDKDEASSSAGSGEGGSSAVAPSDITVEALESGLATFLEGMAAAAEKEKEDCKKQDANIQSYMNGQNEALGRLRVIAQSLKKEGKLDKAKTEEIQKAVKGKLSQASKRFQAAISKKCEFNKLAVLYPSMAVFTSDERLDELKNKTP